MSHQAWANKADVDVSVQDDVTVDADDSDEPPVKKKAVKPAPKKVEKKTEKAEPKKSDKKPDDKASKKDDKKPDAKPDAKIEGKPANAAPDVLACPESIKVDAQKLDKKNTPTGFSSYNEDVTYWLDAVNVYVGEKTPEKMEPYKSTEVSSEWKLEENGKQHYSLVCGYRETSVVLRKAISEKMKACHLSPKNNPQNPHGPQVLQQFDCE